MKKSAFFLFFATLLYGGVDYDNQTGENIVRQISGDDVTSTAADRDISYRNRVESAANYEEVIFQHLLEEENENNKKGNVYVVEDSKINFSFDIEKANNSILEKKRKEAAERLAQAEKAEQKRTQKAVRFGNGYCYLDKNIEISKIATYAYLQCDFQPPFNKVTLAVSMVPEFYAGAVIATPLYVSKEGERFPVANGAIMTKDRNSVNLANYVNDNMTKKIAAAAGIKGVGAVAEQAEAFMTQKRESDKEQTVVTTSAGLATVTAQETTVKEPVLGEYLAAAGIEFASEVVKIVGEAYIKSLPYVFKVNKGSIFFADVQFAEDINMEGYKIVQDNIVKKEPAIVDGIEEVPVLEKVPVLNDHSTSKTEDTNTYTKKSQKGISPEDALPSDTRGKAAALPALKQGR